MSDNKPAKKSLGQEFKEFVLRGNVMDLAVGIIIGGAFTAIVTSLVNNIFMPIVGVFIGGLDFSGLMITVGSAEIKYGLFIQSVISFLVIAAVVFFMIKALNTLADKARRKKAVDDAKEEKKPSEEVVLLTEIRDALRANQK